MTFDLSIAKYVSGTFLAASALINPITPAIATNLDSKPATGVWSNQYALDLNDPSVNDENGNSRNVLPNTERNSGNKNYQINALYDFLALYSVTRDNGSQELLGWDDLVLTSGSSDADRNKIRTSLFGDGTKTGSLISNIHIGGTGSSTTHQRMREVLDALDITAINVVTHQDHFHLYLRPPKDVEIEGDGSNNLMANTEQEVQNSIQSSISEQSEDTFDAKYHQCQTLVQTDDRSWRDFNIVGPSSGGVAYYNSRGLIYDHSSWRSTVVEGPQHGSLEPITEKDGASFNYLYVPNNDYIGPDQITFILEAGGKRIKVVESVFVSNDSFEDGHPGCENSFGIEEIQKNR